jgi:hypothetical protein
MPDDNQILIPRSFIELFIPPGKVKPRETREHIAARYELCEDMAQMLTEPAQNKLFELGITEPDVLERMRRGLLAEGSALAADEAGWVIQRLAELLGWPPPIGPRPLQNPD